MKHQLENGMYCIRPYNNKAILDYVSLSNIDAHGFTSNDYILARIRQNNRLTIYFTESLHGATKEIPVTEFISRLKGEWNEKNS